MLLNLMDIPSRLDLSAPGHVEEYFAAGKHSKFGQELSTHLEVFLLDEQVRREKRAPDCWGYM